MRKVLLTTLLLVLPSGLWAQAALRVSSSVGPAEWRPVSGQSFKPLAPAQAVQAGDEVRTGAGAQLILEVPDGSYMVISENSKLIVEDFWSGNLRSLVNLMVGKVRFYVQRLGGKPNPYRVQTPTALIAVRGTIFEVTSYDPKLTEVSCMEGSVTVQTLGLPDREAILQAGMHTMVQAGVPPVMPIALNEPLIQNRVIPVVRKDGNDAVMTGANASSSDRLV